MTPRDSTCSAVSPFTAACVPTGINVGSIVTPSNQKQRLIVPSVESRHNLTSQRHSGHSRTRRVTSCNDFELHANARVGGSSANKIAVQMGSDRLQNEVYMALTYIRGLHLELTIRIILY